MNAVLSPELLHPGAFFVLEQSGLLIRDGEFLYQHSRWANAIVLAVFSMEELGKSSMVLETNEGCSSRSAGHVGRFAELLSQSQAQAY